MITADGIYLQAAGWFKAPVADIICDFQQLSQSFDDFEINLVDKTISVVTKFIEMEKIRLGRFRLTMRTADIQLGIQVVTSLFSVKALDPNPPSRDKLIFHPNINFQGNVCLGYNAQAVLSKIMADFRIADAFELINTIMHSSSAGHGYVKLQNWVTQPVVCADCAFKEEQAQAQRCTGCPTYFCKRCINKCACGGVTCQKCVKPCKNCGINHCQVCPKSCEGCKKKFCPSCTKTCKSCPADTCENCQLVCAVCEVFGCKACTVATELSKRHCHDTCTTQCVRCGQIYADDESPSNVCVSCLEEEAIRDEPSIEVQSASMA